MEESEIDEIGVYSKDMEIIKESIEKINNI